MSSKSKKVAADSDPMGYQPEPAPPIPWPEWTDSELNAEKWDNPKNGSDGQFLDTQPVIMPLSLQPYDWRRGPQLKDLIGPPILYKSGVEYPDFITNNKHLLHSEFVRWFISTMINLQYCGRSGLQIEGESMNFVWAGSTQCWQGWLHLYSLNKAGKGAQHRPVINPNGKYVVRLYFMGSWRRILVDDMVPVDKGGKALLPYTANNNELWPMLLAKAMLKLAALSWTPQREIVDFCPVACLTGWIRLPLDTKPLSPLDKWNFLTTYAEHFEWPAQRTGDSEIETETGETPAKTAKAKPDKVKKKQLIVPEKPIPTMLFAKLNDTRDLEGEIIPNIAPCWSHPVYIAQSRDIPLDPSQVKPPLARWKLYRWLDWAIQHGLIDITEYFVPIRCLKVISPLKECKESIVYVYEDLDTEEVQEPEVEPPTKEKGKPITPKSSKGSEKLKEVPLPDISLWGDFNKMTPYMTEIQLFYKPSNFEYCAHVSDFLSGVSSQDGGKSKPATAKEGKRGSGKATVGGPPPFVNSYKWQHKMVKSRNEPLYLFIDSVDCKFILIEFSVMQPYASQPSSASAQDKSISDEPLPSSNFSYLTIDRHNWFLRSTEEKPSADVKTLGTTATVLEIEPGRHLLRIFFRADLSYFMTIAADTIFYLGNRLKMHELMSAESDRADIYVKGISNSVSNAFQAFGTPEYAEGLKGLYRSYMPKIEHLQKPVDAVLLKSIHGIFFNELLKIIQNKFTVSEIAKIYHAMRVYFVDPHIGIDSYDSKTMSDPEMDAKYTPSFDRGNQEMEGEYIEPVDYDGAALKIQSFFRMVLIKCYLGKHNPAHRQHFTILESLRMIVELFNFVKRETVAHLLLRSMIKQDDRLKDLYSCHTDFQQVLHVQECKGVMVNIQPEQWVPIVRLIINAPEAETVFAAIDLFTYLPSYMLRIFNNNSGREMLRVVNSPVPTHFRYIRSGYTVFGYGWSEVYRFKELEWTLHMVTVKGESMFYQLDDYEPISATTEIPNLIIEELSNNYIPNIWNLICRWFLEVTTRSFVSFRLQTSYNKVQTKLRVIDEDETVLSEVLGSSTIILPHVCLEYDRRDSSESYSKNMRYSSFTSDQYGSFESDKSMQVTKYFLEAYVLNDSWPLTETEWGVVEDLKLKGTIYNPTISRISTISATSGIGKRQSESGKLKQLPKKSIDSTPSLEQPFWTLQVVSDVGAGLEVVQDRYRVKEIAAMKLAWEASEPGRLQRGRLLREAFLDENCLIISASIMSGPTVSMTSDGFAVVKSGSGHASVASWMSLLTKQVIRTLKPPVNLRQMLPALDLTMYMVKEEEEEDRWVKTESDEEMLRTQRAINMLDFEQTQMVCLEEMAEILNDQQQRYILLFQHYNDEVATWKVLMDEANEERQFYIEETKAAALASRGSKRKK